jgi:hypothetical protein
MEDRRLAYRNVVIGVLSLVLMVSLAANVLFFVAGRASECAYQKLAASSGFASSSGYASMVDRGIC